MKVVLKFAVFLLWMMSKMIDEGPIFIQLLLFLCHNHHNQQQLRQFSHITWSYNV